MLKMEISEVPSSKFLLPGKTYVTTKYKKVKANKVSS